MQKGGGIQLVYKNEKPLFVLSALFSILAWIVLIAGTFGAALVYILIGFVFYLFTHSALISYLKGTAVRITPEQFPDLHQRILACCKAIGMVNVPEAYLLHGDGIFNAFATRFLGRNFIVLFSDVVDALESQPGAINFYIGHELGHIHRGHLKWGPVLFPASILPLLGTAYSRAREYTCDRYGYACCENPEDAVAGLAALAAGGRRWRTLNRETYAAQIHVSQGFWMSFHELIADYPWLVKRMAALNALASNKTPQLPRRAACAWVFALFIPRMGVGGGPSSILVTAMMLGIIMAIAVPAYLGASTKTQVSAALERTEEVRQAIENYAVENKAWPENNEVIGVPEDSGYYGNGIGRVVVEDGIINITFSHPTIRGKTLTLSSGVESGEVVWECSSKDIPAAHLPPECR